jgi:hypothetical protein
MEIYMDCQLLGLLRGHPTTAIGRVGGTFVLYPTGANSLQRCVSLRPTGLR